MKGSESRHALETVLELVEANVLVVDSTGAVISATGLAKALAQAETFGEDGITPVAPHELPVARALRGEIVEQATFFVRGPGFAEGRFFSIHARPWMTDRPEPGALLVLKDQTAERRLEAEKAQLFSQLAQASKLISLGTMGCGIAHELNNPLVSVKGFAQLIENNEQAPEQVRIQAGRVFRAALRMQKIVDHVRVFARRSDATGGKPLSLNEPIREALLLLEQQLLYRGVSVCLSLDPAVPDVLGDPHLLESIFQNLMTNSRDAFESVRDGRTKQIRIRTERDGQGDVRVIYEDNAGGLPESIRRRLFQPFFTTKQAGEGTGLGMYIIKQAVEASGGRIQVETVPGKGTSFTLRFPACAGKRLAEKRVVRPAERPQWPQPQGPMKVRPRVLVIDDEPDIAELFAESIRSHFRVELCCDPERALERIEKESFQLIVSDLSMPKISGIAILSRVKHCQPDTPVIIMSGYSEREEPVQAALSSGAIDSIAKPFENPRALCALLMRHVRPVESISK